ncbi:MAG: hypothetical protein JWN76_209 [Chitinophagaceae bacterium]|nr:hypothetical protein [Chitinophagaceae bacterium]
MFLVKPEGNLLYLFPIFFFAAFNFNFIFSVLRNCWKMNLKDLLKRFSYYKFGTRLQIDRCHIFSLSGNYTLHHTTVEKKIVYFSNCL